MNLDDRTLTLLAVQLLLLSAAGGIVLLLKTSAATRVWCIRLTVFSVLALAFFSQLPVTQRLPAQRLIMLPPQINAVETARSRVAAIGAAPSSAAGANPVLVIAPHIPVLDYWMAGVCIGLLWSSFGWLRIRKIRRRSTHWGDYKGIEVRTSALAGSPLVAGLFRPKLYLPAGIEETLTPEELQSVFAHEVAHVEHRDLLWKALHRLTCILLWPNAVLWLLIPPHNRGMEELADAKAALASETPEQYASLLLAIARRRKGRDASFALAMTPKRSNIGRRVRLILGSGAMKELALMGPKGRTFMSAGALVSVVAILVGFGWQKAPKDPNRFPWQKLSGTVAMRILGPDHSPAVQPQAWLGIMSRDESLPKYSPLPIENGKVRVDRSGYSAMDGAQVLARDAAGHIGSIRLVGSASEMDLVLQPTTTVSGTLLRPDGSPATSVKIAATMAFTPSSADGGPYNSIPFKGTPLASESTTDGRGNFELAGVPQNSVLQLRVDDPSVQDPIHLIKTHIGNSVGTTYGFQMTSQGRTNLGVISLVPAGKIAGRVVLNGHGVEGIRVGAQKVNDDMDKTTESSWGDAVTDANGNYTIGGLGNAKYNVALFRPSDLSAKYAAAARESVSVEVGKTVSSQDMLLEPGGVIEGDVALKNNADPEGYPVAYYGPDHPQSSAWCGGVLCNAKGHFTLRVSPGKQYVYLQAAQNNGQDVQVEAGQTVHVTLKE
jgi:beta-lactamase regulating signal transducer with metallopeptidase domain